LLGLLSCLFFCRPLAADTKPGLTKPAPPHSVPHRSWRNMWRPLWPAGLEDAPDGAFPARWMPGAGTPLCAGDRIARLGVGGTAKHVPAGARPLHNRSARCNCPLRGDEASAQIAAGIQFSARPRCKCFDGTMAGRSDPSSLATTCIRSPPRSLNPRRINPNWKARWSTTPRKEPKWRVPAWTRGRATMLQAKLTTKSARSTLFRIDTHSS